MTQFMGSEFLRSVKHLVKHDHPSDTNSCCLLVVSILKQPVPVYICDTHFSHPVAIPIELQFVHFPELRHGGVVDQRPSPWPADIFGQWDGRMGLSIS